MLRLVYPLSCAGAAAGNSVLLNVLSLDDTFPSTGMQLQSANPRTVVLVQILGVLSPSTRLEPHCQYSTDISMLDLHYYIA